jgi:hypothetical protein
MTSRRLYRGISAELYSRHGSALVPKVAGAFQYIFSHDGSMRHDGSATHGASARNAVLRHELRQEGFPTAGVSTTPAWGRAEFYATAGGRVSKGMVIT